VNSEACSVDAEGDSEGPVSNMPSAAITRLAGVS